MKKRFSILTLIFCLTFLVSCTNTPEINRKVLPMSTGGGVISYGLYGMDGEIETDKHFQINSTSVFEKILSFDNLIEYERDYKLLIFANYEQIDFSVNGEDPNSCYDFSAEPYELTQCALTFPHFDDGFYDLLFIIVKDPNNVNLDEDYRKRTDMSHLTSLRYSLQVGTNDLVNEEPIMNTYDTTEDGTLDGVFLNQNSDELRRLLTLECELFEEPELFIHVGNQSDDMKNYVVFLLYDWQQIPIMSQDMLYFSVPQMSRETLPFNLKALDESGVHNLTAICVEEPFQEATIKSRKADFSIRVGINVN
jgi:hypothetical protein